LWAYGSINADLRSSGATTLGQQKPLLSVLVNNANNATYASHNDIISVIGSGETTAVNNLPVRIGSQCGATLISAGESGVTFPSVNTGMCNIEGLYLTADGGLSIYTGLANNSSNYASSCAMTIPSNHNVGIGTTSPSYKLDVNGTFRSTGDVVIGTVDS